jgi:flagellar hook assembly protein FlgD
VWLKFAFRGYKENNMKVIIALLFVCSFVFAQYQCNWNSLNSGSGSMTSTNYQSQSSVGQTAIGSLTSSTILAYTGFWYPGIVTGITEDKASEIINTNQLVTKLYNAMPNPFRAQTAIRYSLSSESKVAISVYNITGSLVKNIINGKARAGIYNIIWNGRNEKGEQVSAGVYFCKMQTSGFSATRKILLVE